MSHIFGPKQDLWAESTLQKFGILEFKLKTRDFICMRLSKATPRTLAVRRHCKVLRQLIEAQLGEQRRRRRFPAYAQSSGLINRIRV